MTNKPLCIFHSQGNGSHCDDGLGGAVLIRQYFGRDNVDFFPGVYGKAPPDVTFRDVILVDFSYKRPVMEKIIKEARSVLILDHHKTARDDLSNLTSRRGVPAKCYAVAREWFDGDSKAPMDGALGVTFDMERSGAGLAWDFFSDGMPRPKFVNYLEDRDLWRKALPDGDQFTIAVRSYPQEFDVWDSMMADPDNVRALISEGRTLWRYYTARCDEISKTGYMAHLDDHVCWIANAPYFAASEVAGALANTPGADFGACYFEVRPGEWQYSLRSRGDFDVSAVALKFGGGGHAGAAGFTQRSIIHTPLKTDNEIASTPRGIL